MSLYCGVSSSCEGVVSSFFHSYSGDPVFVHHSFERVGRVIGYVLVSGSPKIDLSDTFLYRIVVYVCRGNQWR